MIELVAEHSVEFPFAIEFTTDETGAEDKGSSSLEVTLASKGTNRVLLGEPQATNLLAIWPQGVPLDPQIRELKATSDFLAVRLACSFVPAPGCRFSWVRLDTELSGCPDGDVPSLAYDLFPRSISQPVRYNRRYSVTPSLKLSFVEASVMAQVENEGIEFRPRMDAVGLLTNTPGWTFQSDERSGLRGSREMFLIVRAPKSGPVSIGFRISAEVRGGLGPIPLHRSRQTEGPAVIHVLRP